MAGYNADEKQKERAQAEYTIGGRVFVPAKKTRALMKDLMASQPKPQADRDDNDPEAAAESIDVLYAQIKALLRDKETNEPPADEVLDEELDMEDAGEIVAVLMPNPTPDTPQGPPVAATPA